MNSYHNTCPTSIRAPVLTWLCLVVLQKPPCSFLRCTPSIPSHLLKTSPSLLY